MGFYEDLISGFEGLIGQGKRFKHNAALAEFCDVPPSQTDRYVKGQTRKHLESLGNILDKLGAKIVFPGQENAPSQSDRDIEIRSLNEKTEFLIRENDLLRKLLDRYEKTEDRPNVSTSEAVDMLTASLKEHMADLMRQMGAESSSLFTRIETLVQNGADREHPLPPEVGAQAEAILKSVPRRDIQAMWDKLNDMAADHPELSRAWLYAGMGRMYTTDEPHHEKNQGKLRALAAARKMVINMERDIQNPRPAAENDGPPDQTFN